MKTAIIIIIIICVLYVFGAFNEKPADKPAPIRRNRRDEDRKTMTDWLDQLGQWDTPESKDLAERINASIRFGHNANDMAQFRAEIKTIFLNLQNPKSKAMSQYLLIDSQTARPYFINRSTVSYTDDQLRVNKITLWQLCDTPNEIDSSRIMCADKVMGEDQYIPVHKSDDPDGYMASLD